MINKRRARIGGQQGSRAVDVFFADDRPHGCWTLARLAVEGKNGFSLAGGGVMGGAVACVPEDTGWLLAICRPLAIIGRWPGHGDARRRMACVSGAVAGGRRGPGFSQAGGVSFFPTLRPTLCCDRSPEEERQRRGVG